MNKLILESEWAIAWNFTAATIFITILLYLFHGEYMEVKKIVEGRGEREKERIEFIIRL